MTSQRKPYDGLFRRLVIGIDIGTTCSGVSYSILEPEKIPEIRQVTRFPASQEALGGVSMSKIPSVMWYDSLGEPRSFGAEALEESVTAKALDEQWIKVEWFKLFMVKSEEITKQLAPLPPGKDIISIFADFLRYLFHCTGIFIRESHYNGKDIWRMTTCGNVDYVLTHPNAWDGQQQSQLREAAISAGLVVGPSASQTAIRFVTEGEASLHFCLQNGIDPNVVQSGKAIIVIDAGGGTTDISCYTPIPYDEDEDGFAENAIPHCHFNGSVFVSRHARKFLSEKLCHSIYADDLDDIVKAFDEKTKLRFRSADESQFIKFGRPRDNDPLVGIAHGQMKLSGPEVAAFFEPSISSIIQSVCALGLQAECTIQTAFLVGGFAASDWLFRRLEKHFRSLGVEICRPDTQMSKAVSDGAIGYFIDHRVSIRMSRYHFGILCVVPYTPYLFGHRKRSSKVICQADQTKVIPGRFSTILEKAVRIKEATEFRATYSRVLPFRSIHSCRAFNCSILQYVGSKDSPLWVDEEPAKYKILCSIPMHSATVQKITSTQLAPGGNKYHELGFDVILRFGLTELEAQFAWVENGVEKRSPAKIFYPDNSPPVVYNTQGLEDEEVITI